MSKNFVDELNKVSISGDIKPILCLIDETKTQLEVKNLLAPENAFIVYVPVVSNKEAHKPELHKM